MSLPPVEPETRPLSLEHRPLLHPLLKGAGTTLSEYSFANLYLFRKRHGYRLATGGAVPLILGITYDGLRYAMPAADLRTLTESAREGIFREAEAIFPVPEEWLSAFDPGRYAWTSEEGDADYIYPTERICTYSGRKMHGKKNLRNQFVSQYRHQGFPLTPDRVADAFRLVEAWQSESGLPPEATDYAACLEALEMAEDLQLCGGIYYVGDAPAGFLLGEELGREMFVIHFAKALKQFKGVYQFLFSSFACLLPGNYLWLNFEQDLGQEGLRASKQSYVPEFLQKKFRVTRRGGTPA